MKKTSKSDLCTELEKVLHKNIYVHHQHESRKSCHNCWCHWMPTRLRLWTLWKRDLSTHFLEYIYGVSSNSNRIDFVFDTYIEGSIKDSERKRRCKCSLIDLNEVLPETPLPVTTEVFWAFSMNKTKLQELLRSFIMDKPVASMDTVGSAIGVSDIEPCRDVTVMRDINTPLFELDVHIEEADVRMIPHALHCGASRVVILSKDTDVMVLGLHYWNLLKGHGLKELLMRVVLGIQHDIFHFI